jgi:hypothetical protein
VSQLCRKYVIGCDLRPVEAPHISGQSRRNFYRMRCVLALAFLASSALAAVKSFDVPYT